MFRWFNVSLIQCFVQSVFSWFRDVASYVEAERQFQRTLEAVQEVSDDVMADAWEPLLNNLGHVYRKLRWGISTRAVFSSSSDTVNTHVWILYTGLFLELSFSKSGGVHDMLHIYPLYGIFYFPLA